MSMPGGMRMSRRYTNMAAFRQHELVMHEKGWLTATVKEQPARGRGWRRLFRGLRRPQVDVSYTR